jgi:hypothetical protein
MTKNLVKYFLVLTILLTSGASYLSATSIDLTKSKDARVKNAQHIDFAIKTPLSGTKHKIDLAENEIEEDESDLPIRFLESYNYSPALQKQTAECFIRANTKDIPFYLRFCTIRI